MSTHGRGLRRRTSICGLLAVLGILAASGSAQIAELAFLDSNTVIPSAVTQAVAEQLPEKSNAGASFIADIFSANLLLSGDATVSVITVWEGAGYRNSLGYFTYTENPFSIIDRQLIFPNFSLSGRGGKLKVGDTSILRDEGGSPRMFSAGTRIGFFLVADGFKREKQIKKWKASKAKLPYEDPKKNAKASKKRGLFTTIDAINPEQASGLPDISRHVAMIAQSGVPGFLGGAPFLLMGFEDLHRKHGDDDFNDAVLIVQSTPPSAIDISLVAPAAVADPDGDGIVGAEDNFPDDPDRALITSTPSFGWNGIGLEDLYPSIGDGDYNDAVLIYRIDTITNADGLVKDVMGTFHLLARGAAFNHRLGLHIPGLPAQATGTVAVERFLSDDAGTHVIEPIMQIADLVSVSNRRLETILPNTSLALPNLPGQFMVNTLSATIEKTGASSRFVMTFDTPVDGSALGRPPYDLYWLVNDGSGFVDIHFAGFDSFPDMHAGFPVESGEGAYLDDLGFPWMIAVPYDWRFPLETQPIHSAFPKFMNWAASHGVSNHDWFGSPKLSRTSLQANKFLQQRAWNTAIPIP